ncbi:MAG: magnesium transporter, partial [Alphaproteobacteria bacterium]
MAQSGVSPSGERDQLGGLYGLTSELVRDVQTALAEDRTEAVAEAIGRLHAADQADLFEQLAPDERERMVSVAAGVLQPEFFAYLDETVREEMLEELDTGQIAAVIQGLDSDDAIDLIEDLEEDEQRELLAELPAAARAQFEQGLAYPEDSAGRLMQREAAIVPSFWTVGRTIDHMRAAGDEVPKTFYDIFVLGPTYRPLGIVPVSRLLR